MQSSSDGSPSSNLRSSTQNNASDWLQSEHAGLKGWIWIIIIAGALSLLLSLLCCSCCCCGKRKASKPARTTRTTRNKHAAHNGHYDTYGNGYHDDPLRNGYNHNQYNGRHQEYYIEDLN
jgi:hypothetical protein